MFRLPSLAYELNALEPYISERTMQFHYLKHHQTYIDTLNKLIVGTQYENMSLSAIIRQTAGKPEYTAIFNNAAQAWNHDFFWNSMTPNGGGAPKKALLKDLETSFGNYENFRQTFKTAALTQFGSGWVWLIRRPDGRLDVIKTANADNPLVLGFEPILTLDVWEHAYYLDYQNRRGDFADTFLDHLVDWKE
jgi:Fe-Mn family superoxide dismutase